MCGLYCCATKNFIDIILLMCYHFKAKGLASSVLFAFICDVICAL